MSNKSKYYNHDSVWQKRAQLNNPFYGSYSSHLYGKLIRQIQSLHPRSLVGLKLLDVGCGAGMFGLKVVEYGMDYTGVDESSVAIEIGLKHNPGIKLKVLDFALDHILSPNELNAYDMVTCINTLHCLIEKDERVMMLTNIRKALKSEGLFLITTMCGPFTPVTDFGKPPRHYGLVSDIRGELHQAGFKEILWQNIQTATPQAPIPNYMVALK